ncbi:MAG: FHA domain-containing protein [Planctomycetota bacterium]
MARLILEEGGQTRRFKLSKGKLTFGSGEGATLRLESDDVAQLHGQIEMGPDGAVLRTAKGVLPATVNGRPANGALTMKSGQVVLVGSARLSVEYDEGEGPAPPPGLAAAAATSRGSRDGGRVQYRRKPTKESSIPTWLLVAVIVVAAGGGGLWLFRDTSTKMAGEEFDFQTRYARYQRERGDDKLGALQILRQIAGEELTAQQRAVVDKELATYSKEMAVVDDTLRNTQGTKWLEVRLRSYYDKWPVASERAHARLFMKRAKWFVAEYPTHPELDYLRRIMERVEPVAKLGTPMELEDLRVDVWGSTAAEPKDFVEAMDAIDGFIAGTSDAGAQSGAEALRKETLDAEREFYDEKLGDAAVVYDKVKYPDKYRPRDAIEDMVRVIVCCATESLRSDAADRLLGISEFTPAMMESYKKSQPSRFERLVEVPALREFAESAGLL